jgi:hypothetical protein
MGTAMTSAPYRAPASPPPVEAPDEAARLGRRRSVHPPARKGRLLLITFAMVVGVAVLAALPALRHPCELSADVIVPLAFILITAVLCGVVVTWGRRAWPLELHEGGLVVVRRGGRDVILFEEVDELWLQQTWVRTWPTSFAQIHALRFVDRAGREHRVSVEVDGALDLLRWILRQTSLPLLPEARAALAAGETLTFGKIKLDRDGITVGRARSAWGDIRFARASLGSLALFRRLPVLPWRTIGLDDVPHPLVFSRLVIERVPRVEQDYPPGTIVE